MEAKSWIVNIITIFEMPEPFAVKVAQHVPIFGITVLRGLRLPDIAYNGNKQCYGKKMEWKSSTIKFLFYDNQEKSEQAESKQKK